MANKFVVEKIERDERQICVTVRGISTGRRIEYLLGANAFYFDNETLKKEFEESPKRAAEFYAAEIDLL